MATSKNNETSTRIAPGALVRGKISGSEDLSIGGRIEGSLHLEGTLNVEAEGVVKANVLVTRAVIAGIVVGNIDATESIQIAAGGRVKGDLHAPRISIVDGAKFAGTIEMSAVEAKPIEEARTMIERRPAPVAHVPRPQAQRPPVPQIVLENAVPSRQDLGARSGEAVPPLDSSRSSPAAAGAFVAPVTTRPTADARRKRIVVKKRS